jgi:rhamnose utilization protein RhaD (predicted bifunctional aldolase and dehydrogenase)/NAD(P)-dependent dehydrogenase (short-subunit alcohol dehydrogenase family)
MKNLFHQQAAQQCIDTYAAESVNQDLALRVYTSRLLGQEPELVLHGGGNTSVKTTMKNIHGEEVRVLCVKGSGWDLQTIGPKGLPALFLEPLLELRKLEKLSDEDMVNAQRCQLLDSSSSNPSIETLLHAFLPHKFIDHTHANAILSLTNQPHGEELIKKIYGERFAIVPYVMPGFDLAKLAAEVYDANPNVEGLVLLKHGIFTFAETAEESYQRMINAVSEAEDYLQSNAVNQLEQITLPSNSLSAADIGPMLRRACTKHLGRNEYQSFVCSFRTNDLIQQFVNGKELESYSQIGVVTPDHIIRTKNFALVLPAAANSAEDYQQIVKEKFAAYADAYHQYFERNNAQHNNSKIELDNLPRIVLVPGVGLFALGETAKAANISADIYENTMKTVLAAQAIGQYTALPEDELFKMEYWSLEQAKLAKNKRLPLTGKVVAISGAAGAIGAATAKAFAALGAELALLDIDEQACQALAKEISAHTLAIACNLLVKEEISKAFATICQHFGGVDITVLNAGAAFTGEVAELDDAVLQKSLDLNFYAQQHMAQLSAAIMKTQQSGGCLLFNVTKQALNPGKNFGPYGIAKAATLALMRQYAIEGAPFAIRANAVNPDRIRSGLLTDDFIKERATARGVTEQDYMQGNLLGSEVLASDVADAFVFLAQAQSTTAAIVTVDGGNIAAAVR